MKTEINIILDEGSSNKAKGNCFETLIRNVLSTHQYKIRQNIRFTGMELDLVAEHKQRKNEILYVECKAKEKVSSIELRTFFANVFHHKANFGYFFRTKELESDAGGLLNEYRNDSRYDNLTFFEPEDVIRTMKDGHFIFEPNDIAAKYKISKKILNVTYFGDFFIYVINESNLLPSHFIIIDAIDNNRIVDEEKVDKIKKRVEELQGLEPIQYSNHTKKIEKKSYAQSVEIETIAEVQEGENWFDPLPASYTYKNFVGRDYIRSQIFEFIKAVQNKETQKRIFYLNGKSGWGKSSLVSEIKGRCRNKYYKNKYFALAIDTRSATSNNFVALAFERLIRKAREEKFISESKVFDTISFTSSVDLLSSESIEFVINELAKRNRHLILIFDQFEDVFRKTDLFKSFYKFLSDITDKKPNIIVGFSWKTEIVIPIEHEAYSYWQQARNQAKEFIIHEFGEKEIDGVIKQLEKSIGKLDKTIKNRIKENSQGLPWFTKKLCIHILQQIQSGVKKDKLIEYNLNIKELFESDKEKVGGDELFALNHIAKKAYEGNFFDVSDIGDVISNNTIESLLNQRLIIRSGANYNIYWDVFRDYLVKGEIPTIGESYLLRQGVNLCFEVFILFEGSNKKETIESLLKKHLRNIGKTSLENILIELRNIGLIRKNDDFYNISNNEIDISERGFNQYIYNRFQNYTPYLLLKKEKLDTISKEDVKRVLKKTIKNEYQDETWDSYSKTLIGWFLTANLDISKRIIEPKKGRGSFTKVKLIESKDKILPKSSLKEILDCISLLKVNKEVQPKFYRDLLLLGIIDDYRNISNKGKILIISNEQEIIDSLKTEINSLPKMVKVVLFVDKNGKSSAKDLVEHFDNDFFDGKKNSSKEIYASKVLTWLKK